MDNLLQCSDCKRTYKRSGDLKRHVKKCHIEKTDAIKVLPFKCNNCSKQFRHRATLELHLRRVHAHKPKQSSAVIMNNPVQCSECKHTFKRLTDLRAHTWKSHKKKMAVITPLQIKLLEFSCKYCGKWFGRLAALKLHQKNLHAQRPKRKCATTMDNTDQFSESKLTLRRLSDLRSPLREFKCNNCGKQFGSRAVLKRHFRKAHMTKQEHTVTADNPVECTECSRSFSRFSDLRRHAKKYHKEEADVIAPLKGKSLKCDHCSEQFNLRAQLKLHLRTVHNAKLVRNPFECIECKRTYKRLGDLRKHVKKSHRARVDEIAPLKVINRQFKCDHCSKQFTRQNRLKLHLKSVHETVLVTTKKKCVLCEFTARYKTEFNQHYETAHEIKVEQETVCFDTLADFASWKSSVEKETLAKFVKEGTTKPHTTTFKCHRSGSFTSRSKGKRHLKSKGSNKINGLCPAMIKLVPEAGGKYKAQFTKTHVGHRNELGNLFLSDSERRDIAAKLAAKVPFDVILNEAKDEAKSSPMERVHLLTRKDLYNIQASFNLHSTAVRHRNDSANIDAWVHDMGDKYVLIYKPQDAATTDYPQLMSDDFLLIIMNAGQRDTLKQFGNDCVCLDGSYGTNQYGLHLHSLMVLDDLRQGFPCAFCVSNRSDEDVMTIFFECVKRHVGLVEAKVFMSDMADVYYSTWSKVMSTTQYR